MHSPRPRPSRLVITSRPERSRQTTGRRRLHWGPKQKPRCNEFAQAGRAGAGCAYPGFMSASSKRFYHGTRADLTPGDLIEPGYRSNFGKRKQAGYTYLTGSLDAATWGAELALGEGPGRIYVVEPTGQIVDDPNLTDTKYPGNPTQSYRSRKPLRVISVHTGWQGHSPKEVKVMKERIADLEPLEGS